jgi:uncharacterized protein (TIGR02001 family)
MRKIFVLGALLAAGAAPAFAQEAPTYAFSSNFAVTSDYHWRGVTQSDQGAAFSAGVDLEGSNGFYVGGWASTVDFGAGSDVGYEVDLYGGYAFSAAGLDFDLGGIYYAYPDDNDLDFFELYGKVSRTYEALTVGGSLNWDPDNETLYGDVSAGLGLTDTFSLSVGYGSYLEGFGEYSNWNFGGDLALGPVSLGIRYYDNDGGAGDENVSFSLSAGF